MTAYSEVALCPRLETVAACPVCQSRDCTSLFAVEDWLYQMPGEFKLVRCADCGLIYLSERPDAQSLGRYYPDGAYYAYQPPASHSLFWRGNALASAWYHVKKSVLAYDYDYTHFSGSRAIARLMRLPVLKPLYNRAIFGLDVLLHRYVAGGRLLEVGCGAGRYLDLMRALGWENVVGVDFSRKAVDQARDVLGLEVYCGELREVELEPDSFDAVSLSHTLEHVPDPVEFLRDIRQVMKPGGRLAIVVPNVESLASRTYSDYWLGLEPPRHLVNFTRRSLTLAIESAGLKIQQITTRPGGGYQVALFSHSRKAGDAHCIYTNDRHRFPLRRRARALALALVEYALCAVGLPRGEVLAAVAVKS